MCIMGYIIIVIKNIIINMDKKRYNYAKEWLENLLESSSSDLGFYLTGTEWSEILVDLAEEIRD